MNKPKKSGGKRGKNQTKKVAVEISAEVWKLLEREADKTGLRFFEYVEQVLRHQVGLTILGEEKR